MEGIAHYVINAVLQEGRSHRDVALATGISKAWVTKLVARYKQGGEAALVPRSRRPRSCAHAIPPAMQQAILDLREQLEAAGHVSRKAHVVVRHPFQAALRNHSATAKLLAHRTEQRNR